MAVTSSPRLGLTRWSAQTDPQTRAQQDASHLALETLAARFDQFTGINNRPAFGVAGRFSTDLSTGLIYYDTGTAWVAAGGLSGAVTHQATAGQTLPLLTWKNAAGVTIATLDVLGNLRIRPPAGGADLAAGGAVAEFVTPTGDSRIAMGGAAAGGSTPALTWYTRNASDGNGAAYRIATSGAGSELLVQASTSASAAYGAETYVDRLRIGRGNTAADIGLSVRGIASQTGALQEWMDGAGAQRARINSDGFANLLNGLIVANNYTQLRELILALTSTSTVGLLVKGAAGQSADLAQFTDPSGSSGVYARITAGGDYSAPTATLTGSSLVAGGAAFAGNERLTVKGAVGQSVDLATFRNSSDTILAKIAADGTITAPNIVSPDTSAWTAFTPGWGGSGTAPALGNGTIKGRFKQIGKTVHFRIQLQMGSTSTYGTGSWNFSGLPVQVVNTGGDQIAQLQAYDSSANARLLGSASLAGSTFVTSFRTPSLTTPPLVDLAAAVPWTWALNDMLTIWGTYESV